jgi:ABC-type anion transport system duplicated permease subunit
MSPWKSLLTDAMPILLLLLLRVLRLAAVACVALLLRVILDFRLMLALRLTRLLLPAASTPAPAAPDSAIESGSTYTPLRLQQQLRSKQV